MIKAIEATDMNSVVGRCWGKNVVKFTDGINVIYGPNGCGKSILLRQIGYYSFVSGKGWSRGITPRTDQYSNISNYWRIDVKEYIEKNNKLGRCDVDWDGIATFKTDGALIDGRRIVSEIMCGCENRQDLPFDKLKYMEANNLSNGQRSMLYVDNLLDLTVPDLSVPVGQDTYFKEVGKVLSNYVTSLTRDGKPTLLIDEIDNFMDFDNLYWFWKEAITKLALKYQIIIVTHNPMFLNADMNIIGSNHYDKSMRLLKSLPSISPDN